jgi:hypothetical protein
VITDKEIKLLGAVVKEREGLEMEQRKKINKAPYGEVTGVG